MYLASPYGFAESTRGFLEELKDSIRNAGHVVINPWELGVDLVAKSKALEKSLAPDRRLGLLRRTNHALGRTNKLGIDRSEVVVAALDGPDVDSGTASEIGYAFARGKTILGYRGDLRLTGRKRPPLSTSRFSTG